MRDQNSFGRFISGKRKHMCMTQADLAERIGVSKSAIAKWETDGGLPDRDNLRKLSDALNMSVDDLHQIIEHEDIKAADLKVNITPDVIDMLESYGYKVISPGEKR